MSKVGNQTNSQDPQAVNSRVFVGNLNTFQCSKTDVERMFQRYGRLAGNIRQYHFIITNSSRISIDTNAYTFAQCSRAISRITQTSITINRSGMSSFQRACLGDNNICMCLLIRISNRDLSVYTSWELHIVNVHVPFQY